MIMNGAGTKPHSEMMHVHMIIFMANLNVYVIQVTALLEYLDHMLNCHIGRISLSLLCLWFYLLFFPCI